MSIIAEGRGKARVSCPEKLSAGSEISVAFLENILYNTTVIQARRCTEQKCIFPGVAQLVGRLIWVQDAGSSNLPTRTKKDEQHLLFIFFALWEIRTFIFKCPVDT